VSSPTLALQMNLIRIAIEKSNSDPESDANTEILMSLKYQALGEYFRVTYGANVVPLIGARFSQQAWALSSGEPPPPGQTPDSSI
jgi:hypothetical protein